MLFGGALAWKKFGKPMLYHTKWICLFMCQLFHVYNTHAVCTVCTDIMFLTVYCCLLVVDMKIGGPMFVCC